MEVVQGKIAIASKWCIRLLKLLGQRSYEPLSTLAHFVGKSLDQGNGRSQPVDGGNEILLGNFTARLHIEQVEKSDQLCLFWRLNGPVESLDMRDMNLLEFCVGEEPRCLLSVVVDIAFNLSWLGSTIGLCDQGFAECFEELVQSLVEGQIDLRRTLSHDCIRLSVVRLVGHLLAVQLVESLLVELTSASLGAAGSGCLPLSILLSRISPLCLHQIVNGPRDSGILAESLKALLVHLLQLCGLILGHSLFEEALLLFSLAQDISKLLSIQDVVNKHALSF